MTMKSNIGIKMDLKKKLNWQTWAGFIWLRKGVSGRLL